MDKLNYDEEPTPDVDPSEPPTSAVPLSNETIWGEPSETDADAGLEPEAYDETTGEVLDEPADAELNEIAESEAPEPAETPDEQRAADKYTVPLKEHVKLRERAQRAERERDEALHQLAERTEAERDAARQRLAAMNAVKKKATESEAAVIAAHPDYGTVTKTALSAQLLSPQEQQSILEAENPAEQLYQISRARVTEWVKGVLSPEPAPESPKPTAKPQEPAERDVDELNDEQLAELIFGKPKK